MPEIRELDPETVAQIAAGEVVERPASVVKELVENSLDAGATRIDVDVEAGGTESVSVADDGHGMDEAAARAAVREHTTSKIDGIEDLETGVGSLGFRGEALHTIGAVSRLTLTTRAEGERGIELRYEGGEVTDVCPAGCPVGTTVTVEDLFYNTPARRKYLKAESTEFGRINRVVSRYALANPDVAVSLTHDGRETFATTGRGDCREAILAVYGREIAESMIDVEADAGSDSDADGDSGAALADTPVSGLRGYVSHPETTRSSREYLATFVNGRAVADGAVREAVLEAYGEQLAPDRFPFAVLFLELDPGGVDVNVHPRKTEVRYGDEAGVRAAVETAVERALLDAGLVRSGAPRGRSAPDDATIDPGWSGRTESDETERASETDRTDGVDGVSEADRAGQPGDTDRSEAFGDAGSGNRAEADESAPGASGADGSGWSGAEQAAAVSDRRSADPESGATPDPAPESGPEPESESQLESQSEASSEAEAAPAEADGVGAAASAGDSAREPDPEPDPDRKFRPASQNARLPGTGTGIGERGIEAGRADSDSDSESGSGSGFGPDVDADAAESEAFDTLPAMRILGQVRDTYVLGETADGLVLIDQHAADERVNYERLCERAAARRGSQSLLVPVELELTAGEAAVFADALPALREAGFEARLREADRTAVVGAVPAALGDALDPDLLRDLLDSFLAGREPGGVEAAADELLADLACYPSVTGDTSLAEGSILELLRALNDCENPYACPHGRPVIIELSAEELADRFERDYPGHRTRRPE